MAQAQQVGQFMRKVVDNTITETVTCAPLTATLSLAGLDALPRRLDDRDLALVTVTAEAPLPALQRCDERHFAKCMRTLALLPRRADDDTSGDLRHQVYRAKLSHYPNEALSMLVSLGLERFKFFPSIAECLELLGQWERSDDACRAKRKAASMRLWEVQTRFDEAIALISDGEMSQDDIDALPDRWKRIVEVRNLLRLMPDGQYVLRADPITRNADGSITPSQDNAA